MALQERRSSVDAFNVGLCGLHLLLLPQLQSLPLARLHDRIHFSLMFLCPALVFEVLLVPSTIEYGCSLQYSFERKGKHNAPQNVTFYRTSQKHSLARKALKVCEMP